MSMKAWPFLVGRNKALPYQVIVSPQFLSEHALSYILEHAVVNKDYPSSRATLREIHGTNAGNISVIFRNFRPHAQDVGTEGKDELTDKFGRSIPLVEGLVVRDIDQTQDIVLTQEDLQIAHDEVMKAYRVFWAEDKRFPEQVSQPFDLHIPTDASDQVTLNAVPPLVIPEPKSTSPILPKYSKAHQGNTRVISTLVALLVIVVSVASIFYYRSSFGNPLPSGVGQDGIGVNLIDGEYIGISDGRYAFDTNRTAGSLVMEASASLRNGDPGQAMAQWDTAHQKDTSDAEPLIYAENQHVLASHSPYMTIVVGVSLGVNVPDGFGRDTLQAAYIAQKECNENPQLSGGKKLRLLIARSGSDPKRSEDIAKQIVQAAQFDKTIVGVQGWTTSETTLNAVKILADAHLPVVASDTASDELTGISPYFFRVGTPSRVSTPLEATYIEKQLKSQRLVILRDPDEPYGRGTSADLTQQLAQDGYKVASIEDFKTDKDAKDGKLAQHVQNVLTTYKPDLFYITTNTVGDVITLLNAIPADPKYAGIKVFAGGAGYELVQNLDKVTGNGYTRMLLSSSAFPDEWSILAPGQPEPPFFKDYIAAYDPHDQHLLHPYTYRRANAEAMMGYDAVYAFLVASKNATQQGKQNPTAEDIHKALSQINGVQSFQGIAGVISFDANGDPLNKLHFVLRVVDGGYTHVAAYQGCLLINSNPPCDNDIHILE